jgi:hypothetical protein
VAFDPCLLRACEFVAQEQPCRFLDVDGQWQQLTVPVSGLAFSWCQVPLVYRLADSASASLTVIWSNGERQLLPTLVLPGLIADELFIRSGRIRQLELVLNQQLLFCH